MAERKVKVYGCNNREPLADSLLVQDGWIWKYREPKIKTVKVLMTKDCQYTLSELGKKDAKCFRCVHRASSRATKRASASPEAQGAKAAEDGLMKARSV